MSIYRGLDWWIQDDFGDIWNEEALPTFSQAFDYRNLIRPYLNRVTGLQIISTERNNEPKSKRNYSSRKEGYESRADF